MTTPPPRRPAKPKASRPPAKPKAARPPKFSGDLRECGAHVVSVFGPVKAPRVLIEMPAAAAEELFPDGLARSARTNVIDGAEHEVNAIRDRDAELADSALAASAIALAREIENPYNSATSKSMCAREMRDTLDRLRELAPEKEREDSVDELKAQRAKRRATAKKATSANTSTKPAG